MNYQDALRYISDTRRFGSKLGLERVGALLSAMGNPHRGLKCVHIAGTNGKGSSAAMTESVLRAAGYKTGMYISPHVDDFRECVMYCGEKIAEEELARRMEVIAAVIEELVLSGGPQPTEFEIITALALQYFRDMGAEISVIEVGLGGLLDSTNIIDPPLAAVIMSISHDHTEFLGNTISGIAAVKCGIIKRGCRVVTYPEQPPEVLEVIINTCASLNAPLFSPDTSKLRVTRSGLDGSDIVYGDIGIHVPLMGAHQVKNALTVIGVIDALRDSGLIVPENAVVSGIASTRWNGRLEIVSREPLCVVDGAHNFDGVRVLREVLDSVFLGRDIVTVMGMLSDKDYAHCVPVIAERSRVFISAEPESPRALPSSVTAGIASAACGEVLDGHDAASAVRLGIGSLRENDVLLVCGSLMLVGPAKKHIQRHDFTK